MAKAKSKKTKSARKTPLRKATVRVRRQQWDLAAGFVADGSRPATLREVLSPHVATIDGDQLSAEQRAELTAHRIAAQEEFRLGTGIGVIDKDRAIEEVRNGTPLGNALVAIEHRAIEMLREEAVRRRRNLQRSKRASRLRRTRNKR